MIAVSPFAGRCLSVVAALFDRADRALIQDYVDGPTKPSLGLTADEMGALKDRLRAGAAGWLAGLSWVDGIALKDDVRRGPSWIREPASLDFGPATFQMVRWLAAGQPRLPLPRAETLGDHLVGVRLFTFVGSRAAFISPLTALVEPNDQTPDLAPLVGPLAPLVGALQPWLAERWIAQERAKSTWAEPRQFIAHGERQAATLEAWIQACQAARRPDLTTFLVDAARKLRHRAPAAWVAALDREASLADRQAARRGASAFLSALEGLRSWAEDLAASHFIDEGYDAAQAILNAWGDWRAVLDEAAAKAATLVDAPP